MPQRSACCRGPFRQNGNSALQVFHRRVKLIPIVECPPGRVLDATAYKIRQNVARCFGNIRRASGSDGSRTNQAKLISLYHDRQFGNGESGGSALSRRFSEFISSLVANSFL